MDRQKNEWMNMQHCDRYKSTAIDHMGAAIGHMGATVD